jgi:beta-xylosidase
VAPCTTANRREPDEKESGEIRRTFRRVSVPRRLVRLVGAVAVLASVAALAPAVAATRSTGATAPVLAGDFPDPYVLAVRALDGSTTWFSFATNTFEEGNVPVATSRDLRVWTRARDALPVRPSWAIRGPAWSPSVLQIGSRFHLYYAVRNASSGKFCLSHAESSWPEGPYADTSLWAFLCQDDRGGVIDPSPFVDADGTPWLLWKSEGHVGDPARLWSQRLARDGKGLVGPRLSILVPDRAWEAGIVEAPAMVRAWGAYWLLYSGNRWDTGMYAVGYARCATPAGPCTKADGPILTGAPGAPGPGSLEVFDAGRGVIGVAYHAWSGPRVGYPHGTRSLRVGRLALERGRLAIRPL